MSSLDWIKLGIGLPPLASDADFSQHMAEYIDRCVNAKLSNMADLKAEVEKYRRQQDYLLKRITEIEENLEYIKKKTKDARCDRYRFAEDPRGYERELDERWAQLDSGVPEQEVKYIQLFTDILRVGGYISVNDDGHHVIKFRDI